VCESSLSGGTNCTLRAAIQEANALANNPLGTPDEIHFNIPGPGIQGIYTITPASALPSITQPLIINGYSQPGASTNFGSRGEADDAILVIELDGSSAGGGANGLDFELLNNTASSTVRGLAIGNFGGAGIAIGSGSTAVNVQGNFIGTDASGTLARKNTFGIDVSGSGNTIGGSSRDQRNVISSNTQQAIGFGNNGGFGNGGNTVQIGQGTGSGNLVQGNFIGTQLDGISPLGNLRNGVAFLLRCP
jgi:hypothetical protein